MSQYDNIHNIGKKYGIKDSIAVVILSNDRGVLYFTTYRDIGIGNAERSSLYKLDLKSGILNKTLIAKGNTYTPTNVYIDSQDRIYIDTTNRDDNEKVVYIYSDNIKLEKKALFITDYTKVNTFIKSGLKSTNFLNNNAPDSVVLLENRDSTTIATYPIYIQSDINFVPSIKSGIPIQYRYTSNVKKDAENRTKGEVIKKYIMMAT